jgi:undecaprenyl-diphosphatase
MPILTALFLGVVQGACEFLPISSSGHLVLGERLVGVAEPGLLLEVLLHAATLGSILVVYRARLGEIVVGSVRALSSGRGAADAAGARLAVMLLVGNLATGVAVLLLRPLVEPLFESPRAVSLALLGTAAVLLLSVRAGRSGSHPLRWRDVLLIGLVQGIAVVPGFSRSGFTITAGLLLGVERERAVEFSFLLSVPAVAAATLLEVAGDARSGVGFSPAYLPAMAAAFVVGIAAIRWVVAWVRSDRFWLWSFWCLAVGILGLLFLA